MLFLFQEIDSVTSLLQTAGTEIDLLQPQRRLFGLCTCIREPTTRSLSNCPHYSCITSLKTTFLLEDNSIVNTAPKTNAPHPSPCSGRSAPGASGMRRLQAAAQHLLECKPHKRSQTSKQMNDPTAS